MKKDSASWWYQHRDALASGAIGFLLTAAVLVWPLLEGSS